MTNIKCGTRYFVSSRLCDLQAVKFFTLLDQYIARCENHSDFYVKHWNEISRDEYLLHTVKEVLEI